MRRTGVLTRFADKTTEAPDGCLPWSACTSAGYGRFWVDGRLVLAHRFAFEASFGPVPDGMQVDHLCGRTLCVEPSHLDAVTPAENVRRSGNPAALNARRSSCVHGHAFDAANTYVTSDGRRQCRTCAAARSRKFSEKGNP